MVKSGTFGDFSAFEAGITHINGADARAFKSKAEQYICVADAVKCVVKNVNVFHAPTAAPGVKRRLPSSFKRSRVEGKDAFSTSGHAISLLSKCKLVMPGRCAEANSVTKRNSSSTIF